MKTKPIFKSFVNIPSEKARPKYRMQSQYDREVYMSEYVTIPKDRYRRLIVSEVVSWGISAFLLIVMVLR